MHIFLPVTVHQYALRIILPETTLVSMHSPSPVTITIFTITETVFSVHYFQITGPVFSVRPFTSNIEVIQCTYAYTSHCNNIQYTPFHQLPHQYSMHIILPEITKAFNAHHFISHFKNIKCYNIQCTFIHRSLQ